MHKEKEENSILSHIHTHDGYRSREIGAFEHSLLDGDMFLQVSVCIFCHSELGHAIQCQHTYMGLIRK